MKEILLNDYKEPKYLIPNVDLYIDIRDDKVIIKSSLTIKANEKCPLILNGKDLRIIEININSEPVIDYKYEDDTLTIPKVPEEFILTTLVEINPYTNKSMEGFYKSGDILCTQNEAEGFRRVTFFLDRPDVMSKYTVTVEGDREKYPTLLSNGNLVESRNLENGRFSNKWDDPFDKPCYLVAIVAGKLDKIESNFITRSNRDIKLEIYTDPGKSDGAVHAMDSLKKSMKWDEDVFGLEYDLDLYMIVAVDSFNAGAMENKGLNIFNSAYVLADPKSATDSDFEGVEGVIAHEYFHNWTGNRVTCRDWFQLTLKEGLTVFRDHEFSSDMTDRTVKRISDVSILRTYQFSEDKGPNSHPIKPASYLTIDNFYTSTVYEKGSEVIRMIHTLIGKDNFRSGMDLYFKRHTGAAVTTEDFVKAMSDASGFDLTQFKRWYSQAGTPVVDIVKEFKDGKVILKIKQSLPKTSYNGKREPMFFPFPIGLYSYDGRDLTPKDGKKLVISKDYEEFTFNLDEDVIPSFAEGFSAPVIVNYNYSIDELIILLTADRDNFNRFDSARRLVFHTISEMIKDLKKGEEGSIDPLILNAFNTLLKDKNLDKRYLATLLYIPEVKDIVATMDEYDFILANRARSRYLEIIATGLKSTLFRLFEDNVREKYEFGKQAVSERSIKNKALTILGYLGDDIAQIALRQFTTADNMTDYIAAYSTLQKCSDSIRKNANNEFFEKWKDNFLVMNKWLAIQAARDSSSVLDDITTLLENPIFDMTNPNRVRSLIGSFASRNTPQFHDISGNGYRFIADKIIEIDGYNSHLSANLASSFQAYQYLPSSQAQLMEKELSRILDVKNLSTALFEIVTKTLKARE